MGALTSQNAGAITGNINTANLSGGTNAGANTFLRGDPLVGAWVRSGITTLSATTSAVDVTLTVASKDFQKLNITAAGKNVILPDATTMINVGQSFLLDNDGVYPFNVKDNGGNILATINPGLMAQFYLETIGTTNGDWSWVVSQGLFRSTRTSNTILTVADVGTFVDVTTGTFAQTFAASSTLGASWYAWVKNSGTGAVTLTPNGAETINGAATLTLSSGQSALIESDGANLFTLITSSSSSVKSSSRSSNTILASTDNSTFVDITTGTFSQTFTAAATLGNGWFCYIRNSGTGYITLDPNASELIDGLTTYIMYPGECRLVICTGSAFVTQILAPFAMTLLSTITFTCPPGYTYYGLDLWGGGAAGSNPSGNNGGSGGGGGARHQCFVKAGTAGSTLTATVAASATVGYTGNSTSWGTLFYAYGGASNGAGGSHMATGYPPSPNAATAIGGTGGAQNGAAEWGGGGSGSTMLSPGGSSYYGAGGGGVGGNGANGYSGSAGGGTGIYGSVGGGGGAGGAYAAGGGANGSNGTTDSNTGSGSGGGGGGGAFNGGATTSGNGGNGGFPGGGGGGGGATYNAGIPGVGGTGAAGQIIAWGII